MVVTPIGEIQTNCYYQAICGDPIKSCVNVDVDSYKYYDGKRWHKCYGCTEESGYTSFSVIVEEFQSLVNYARNFLVSNYIDGKENYTIAKASKKILPISCIEAAEKAIKLMTGKNKVFAVSNGTPMDINEMITDVGTYEDCGNTKDYEGDYGAGDGFLELDENNSFHAIAIVAKFSDGSFIALERNAGTTLINDNDRDKEKGGDDKWLMNYYQCMRGEGGFAEADTHSTVAKLYGDD